jgi:hypothetical protein
MSDRRRGTPAPPTADPLMLSLEVRRAFNRRENDAEEALLKQWTKLGERVLAQDGQQPEVGGTEIKEPEDSLPAVKPPSSQ